MTTGQDAIRTAWTQAVTECGSTYGLVASMLVYLDVGNNEADLHTSIEKSLPPQLTDEILARMADAIDVARKRLASPGN